MVDSLSKTVTENLNKKKGAHKDKKSSNFKGAENYPGMIENYRDMLFLRRFEEAVGRLYGMGQIGGFCHLYTGQEAVIVGTYAEISSENDQVLTSYRDHCHVIMSGEDPGRVAAELLGKETGCSAGKGGSMHLFNPEGGFYGGHGIVGAQVPIGTGIAFANLYKKNNAVCVTFFGDGAANQGQVFESFNMASLWNLPVLYIIENNMYAMGTSVERSTISQDLYKRGEVHGIPGDPMDGMDIIDVRKKVRKAIDYVRSGHGPYLIEAKTYRYKGHSMSDPGKYRERSEVDDMRKNHDPILKLAQLIVEQKISDQETLDKITKEVRGKVDSAIEFAENSKEPDPGDLLKDIYSS